MELRTSDFKGTRFRYQCEPDNHSSFWTFDDERDVREVLWSIRPGDVVLDIGAGYGSYTLTALAAGAAVVHAWTPETVQQRLLCASIEANEWADRFYLHCGGLFHREGWAKEKGIEFYEDMREGFFHVDALDDVVEVLAEPTRYVMKLDTEGAEPEILHGAQRFLDSARPIILVENHDFLRPGVTSIVQNFLLSRGYRLTANKPSAMASHSLYEPA